MNTMKKSQFTFHSYPYRYIAQCKDNNWIENLEALPTKGAEAEKVLPKEELEELLKLRNATNTLPLVNYTTQYGLGCFEGLKAYPQVDGGIALFRADMNAKRFYRSMDTLRMPPFPEDKFVSAIQDILQKSIALGFYPRYDQAWERDNYISAHTIYIRPFTYSESGFGINLSSEPYVIIVVSEVGSFFDINTAPSLLVSDRSRVTPHGNGSIKCTANYVMSSIDKYEAILKGYTESLFLDIKQRKYVEECSSCNIFFVLSDNSVVTPALNDSILPGVTRDSVITLLKDSGKKIEERNISIEEVFDSAIECFYTGTAVGVHYFGKLTYGETHKVFGDGTMGKITQMVQEKLKRIQYGIAPDLYGWRIPVS